MVHDALLRRGHPGPILSRVRGLGSWKGALVGTVVLAALLASCSSDASDGDAERPDRGAQEQSVGTGWDVEFDVKISNASTKPLEVGVSYDPNNRPLFKELISSDTPGIESQAAGAGRAFVVPPTPDGTTAQELDLFIQQKIGSERTIERQGNEKPADEGSQELLIVLPTIQLRFRTDYVWTSQGCRSGWGKGDLTCTWLRTATVNIQTRGGDGYQRHYEDMQYCYDPTRLPNFAAEIGDPAQYWNAVPASSIDTITIDVRGAADLAKPCTTTPVGQTPASYPSAWLPGMSLSAGDNPGARLNLENLRLSEAQMPGIDLRKANLTSTDFTGNRRANLAYAQLDGATLTKTNFSDAILVGASFDGATITDARFPNALLTDVDLSTTKGTLPWEKVSGAQLCRTKLPQATIDDFASKNGGQQPDLNAACGDKLSKMMGAAGGDLMLVDTSSMVPVTLLGQSGTFDCAMPSTVGAFGTIPHPPAGCQGYYGSSRLVDESSLDDDTPRTTTTVAGRQPPLDIVHDGGFTLNPAGPTGATDGLSLSSDTLTNGWTAIACLAGLHDRISGTCRDEHIPLPDGS